MADTASKRTACILCYLNCGFEVLTDDGAIVRVRGNHANERSLLSPGR